MKKNCKQSLTGGGKIANRNLLLTLISLALITPSCNSLDETPETAGSPLQVSVTNNTLQTRTLVTGESLPTTATMGVTVLAADGGAYSTGTFNNLQYTTTDGSTFSCETTPLLVSDEAKAAAYYPYAASTDITAVPVTTAAQTDYMYSGWYTGLKDSNPQAKFNMKHALAAVRIGVQKSASYTPTATLAAVKATSDAFYASATLDATSATGTLSGLTGSGATVEKTSLSQALSTSPYTTDFLVVPGTSAQTITFTVTIGDVDYTATTAAVTLQQGAIHSYTLTLSAAGLSVSYTTVQEWTTNTYDPLTLKINPWKALANGVYAVSATGEPIAYNDASVDATCLGVALITDNQRIMIEKNESSNSEWNGNTTLYWGYNLSGKNVAGITETTDDSVAKTDFNGKVNTAAIIAAYTLHSVEMNARDMCSVLQNFNAGTNNAGYTDWYIPACGQLYEIYSNRTNINAALSAMSGTSISDNSYWSSSECSSDYGWYVYLSNGIVSSYSKGSYGRVRFVRDI